MDLTANQRNSSGQMSVGIKRTNVGSARTLSTWRRWCAKLRKCYRLRCRINELMSCKTNTLATPQNQYHHLHLLPNPEPRYWHRDCCAITARKILKSYLVAVISDNIDEYFHTTGLYISSLQKIGVIYLGRYKNK